ncbi:Triosephosphate isomerase [Saccharata proteae CBS 121410]|uniref:Triosephosphate isomerase n=1 Tax=Saccharata proteae CBS 121410 TaxID=1314787 RepID=A0A9P4I1Q6_9PEZI|nr:Triosephosphate isomerase [Saccharata proteae CBS 121410]
MAAPSQPRRLVGTSLKMYFDLHKTLSYIKGVAELASHGHADTVDLFVIPDFVALREAHSILDSTPVLLGSQDAFWESSGPYTGEVSPLVLQQAGVKIVELGHAERRRMFGEDDAQVAKKAAAAVEHGLIPLVCVGEKTHGSIASAAVGMAIEECRTQVMSVLASVPDYAEIILAYEPVWAIGAKEPADADHVVNVAKALREMVGFRKGTTRILYGGSAGPGTFAKLADGVDGLFLGRFAHDLANLKQVIKEVSER